MSDDRITRTRRPVPDPHYWDCSSPVCSNRAHYRINNSPVCADCYCQWSTRHFKPLKTPKAP